ncbi:MAG: DUF507 family protein [Nitrospinota bacterium]
MKLSREKINQVSKVVLRTLWEDDRIEFFCEKNDLRLEIVDVLRNELDIDEKIDEAARAKIDTYARSIREGTPEWDILYDKHYKEELKKRRGI